MSTVTFTTDLNNKIKMRVEDFKATVVETIDFAVNQKGYAINDLTVEFIAEDITGVIKSWHGKEHDMNNVGLSIIKDVLNEEKWRELADVPFEENEHGLLVLENDWLHFNKGTNREEIWHWFNGEHSKGVHFLLYEFEG